jgi:hypothetical protein
VSDRDDFYSLADARSWALHSEVAVRILAQPELVLRARKRASEWMSRPAEHPYASAWIELLHLPCEELQAALKDKGERMCTLRQASPFAGALDAATRWKILKRPELRPREAS